MKDTLNAFLDDLSDLGETVRKTTVDFILDQVFEDFDKNLKRERKYLKKILKIQNEYHEQKALLEGLPVESWNRKIGINWEVLQKHGVHAITDLSQLRALFLDVRCKSTPEGLQCPDSDGLPVPDEWIVERCAQSLKKREELFDKVRRRLLVHEDDLAWMPTVFRETGGEYLWNTLFPTGTPKLTSSSFTVKL